MSDTFPNRMWISVASTWFAAGETRVEDIVNPDEQRNTRIGATLSAPVGKFQSVKMIDSTGASTPGGTDFDSFSVNWHLVRY